VIIGEDWIVGTLGILCSKYGGGIQIN